MAIIIIIISFTIRPELLQKIVCLQIEAYTNIIIIIIIIITRNHS